MGGMQRHAVGWAHGSCVPFAVHVGSGETIDAGAVLAYERDQPWTVITGLKVGINPPVAAIIFSNVNTSPYPGYEIWIDSVGHLRVRIIHDIDGNYIDVQSSVIVTDGSRHNIATSYDGSSSASGVKMYLDGVLDTGTTILSNSLTGSIVSPTHGPFILGNQTGAEFLFFYFLNGSLNHFSVSNIVRSGSYIANSSHCSPSPVDANTVLVYGLDEGSGVTVHDLSSSSYNATLSNSSMWVQRP